MNNLNSVLLEGNMVRDPLLKSTPKGSQVCTFSLACNRFFKSGDTFEKEVSFFDIETWGALAESCAARGHKGRKVRVAGRLLQNRWTDSDGKSRSRILVVAEHVEMGAEQVDAPHGESPADGEPSEPDELPDSPEESPDSSPEVEL
jgi:single-strand DNA-binding protein